MCWKRKSTRQCLLRQHAYTDDAAPYGQRTGAMLKFSEGCWLLAGRIPGEEARAIVSETRAT